MVAVFLVVLGGRNMPFRAPMRRVAAGGEVPGGTEGMCITKEYIKEYITSLYARVLLIINTLLTPTRFSNSTKASGFTGGYALVTVHGNFVNYSPKYILWAKFSYLQTTPRYK